jgi:predicted dienelactone hydrolase
MRLLEIAFVLLAAGLLVAQTVRGVPRQFVLGLATAGLAAALLGLALEQARWQLAPAYLLFGILLLLLPKRSYSHAAVRSIGVSFGVLLLTLSAAAALGMPIVTLPAPSGQHVVGSTSLSLIDETRDNSFFGAPDEPREIHVQLWYPGEIAAGQPTPRVRTLWEELHRGERDLFTLFSSYLRGIDTHSYVDIPLSRAEARYPVIVFAHAMGSFPEQSTLLMEHLASHGYVVLATSHAYASMRVLSSNGKATYLDLDKLEELSAPFNAAADDAPARMEQAGSAEERTRLLLERYERADGLNALMATWVDDLRFVLDSITITSDQAAEMQAISAWIDADRIGLVGMSFGGGAVTELCKSDSRCRAGLNIDGGTFGRLQREPLEVPFLGMTREGQDFLDYLLSASADDYYAVEVEGATHLDFTDDTVVLPILKWLDITGEIDGLRMIEITNAVALRFFDAYLRGGPKPRFDDGFPELTVRINAHAERSRFSGRCENAPDAAAASCRTPRETRD